LIKNISSDNSHVFEKLYTTAFKIFLAEVCLNEEQIDEIKISTGYFIDKTTGKTFYEIGKLIIEINLDTDNNTIDLGKFKFAKHKFMKATGFQRAIMDYYQSKNYVAVIKPSSPQSMIAKIILYYKPIKQILNVDITNDFNFFNEKQPTISAITNDFNEHQFEIKLKDIKNDCS